MPNSVGSRIALEAFVLEAVAITLAFIYYEALLDALPAGWDLAVIWGLMTVPVSAWIAVRGVLANIEDLTGFCLWLGFLTGIEGFVGVIVGSAARGYLGHPALLFYFVFAGAPAVAALLILLSCLFGSAASKLRS